MIENIPDGARVTYQLQYRRCGKPACGTCKSKQGHGPYWWAYWRLAGERKLHCTYLGKEQPTCVSDTLAAMLHKRIADRKVKAS